MFDVLSGIFSGSDTRYGLRGTGEPYTHPGQAQDKSKTNPLGCYGSLAANAEALISPIEDVAKDESRLTEKKALELSVDVWRYVAEVLRDGPDPDDFDVDALSEIKSDYIISHQHKERIKYCNWTLPYLACWLCEFHIVSGPIWSNDSCSNCALSVKNAETGVVHGCESPISLYQRCDASIKLDDMHNAARLAEMIVETLEKALEEVNKGARAA